MKNNELKGITWMVAACFGATVMVAMVRYASHDMHPFQIVFFRNLSALLWFLPFLTRKRLHGFKTGKLKIFMLRSVVGIVAMFGWFYGISVLPLADATAISFTAPLFTAVIAVLFLGEKIGPHRTAALIIGFLGAVIVLRPGTEGFHPVMLLMVVVSFFWAVAGILIKVLTKTENSSTIVFYSTLIWVPLSLPLALTEWGEVTLFHVIWFAALGLVSNLFQYATSRAMHITEMTVILPFDFTRLIFIAIIAYFSFGEIPDIWTFVGAAIILAGAVYAAYRGARVERAGL